MNIDKEFVQKLISLESMSDYHDASKKVTPEMLFGEGKKAYKFIKDYVNKYSKIPDSKTIKDETGVIFEDVAKEPSEYYIDQIKERHLFNRVGEGTKEIIKAIEGHDGKKAFELLESVAYEIRRDEIYTSKVKSIISLGDTVVDIYDRVKGGLTTGIKSGFPMLDEYTQGWQNEDMVVVVARPGTGKTWLLTVLAEAAWKEGKKVFFVSPEISDVKLAQRFMSLHLKLPYGDLRKGSLGSFLEPKLYDGVNELMSSDEKRFMTLSSEFGIDLNSIKAGIMDYKPDIVFLDGLYLIDAGPQFKDRFSRVSAVADEIKKLNRKYNCPIITSTQFNRNVKPGKKKMSLEDLGLSDVIGWNADWCFGMYQDKDMKLDGRMIIVPLKTRESETIEDVELNWDFQTMDFSQRGGVVMPGASPFAEVEPTVEPDTLSSTEEIPF